MKRLLIVSLAAAMILTMTGCFSNNDDVPETPTTEDGTMTPDLEGDGTEAGDGTDMGDGGEIGDGTGMDNMTPELEMEEATDNPLSHVWANSVNAMGEDRPGSMMDIDNIALEQIYYIHPDDVETFYGKVAMVNIKADEFFIAKVRSGKMDAVEEGIKKRIADLENTWKQYLPDQYELVKNHKIVKDGDYIMFVVSPNTEFFEDEFAALKK